MNIGIHNIVRDFPLFHRRMKDSIPVHLQIGLNHFLPDLKSAMTAIGGESNTVDQERNSEAPVVDHGLPILTTPTAARLRTMKARASAELEDDSSSERSSLDVSRKKADSQRGYDAV